MLDFLQTQGAGLALGLAIGIVLAGILVIITAKVLLIVQGRKEKLFFSDRPPRIAEQSGKPAETGDSQPKTPGRVSNRAGRNR